MKRRDALAEAMHLVVHEGASYAEAAQQTGIPLSTIQKRAAAEDWQGQRDHSMSYAAQIRAAKRALLGRLTTALESDDVTGDDIAKLTAAWKAAETAHPEHRYNPGADPKARLGVIVEVVEELVAYLAEVSPAALKALQPWVMGFGKKMEAKYAS